MGVQPLDAAAAASYSRESLGFARMLSTFAKCGFVSTITMGFVGQFTSAMLFHAGAEVEVPVLLGLLTIVLYVASRIARIAIPVRARVDAADACLYVSDVRVPLDDVLTVARVGRTLEMWERPPWSTLRGTDLRRGARRVVRCADEETAIALEAALRERGVVRQRFRLGSRYLGRLHVGLVALGLAIGAVLVVGAELFFGPFNMLAFYYAPSFAAVMTLFFYEGLDSMLTPPELDIGLDTVTVERSFGRRTFRRADVETLAPGFPSLRLRGGNVLRLTGVLFDPLHVRAAAQALEVTDGAQISATSYGRADKPAAEWLAAIRTRAVEARYRVPATTPDEAAAVLKSAGATSDQRLGAALTLRIAGSADTLRDAARGFTDDALRRTIEDIADAADDAAVDALILRAERSNLLS